MFGRGDKTQHETENDLIHWTFSRLKLKLKPKPSFELYGKNPARVLSSDSKNWSNRFFSQQAKKMSRGHAVSVTLFSTAMYLYYEELDDIYTHVEFQAVYL